MPKDTALVMAKGPVQVHAAGHDLFHAVPAGQQSQGKRARTEQGQQYRGNTLDGEAVVVTDTGATFRIVSTLFERHAKGEGQHRPWSRSSIVARVAARLKWSVTVQVQAARASVSACDSREHQRLVGMEPGPPVTSSLPRQKHAGVLSMGLLPVKFRAGCCMPFFTKQVSCWSGRRTGTVMPNSLCAPGALRLLLF